VLIGAVALLARDYQHRRGGMPDLFLWAVHPREDGSTFRASCFLEVKSPNDRLADKQEVRTCWPHCIDSHIESLCRSGWTSSCGWEDGRRCAGSAQPQGASCEDQSTSLFSLVGRWRHMSLQSGVCSCPVIQTLGLLGSVLCVSVCACVCSCVWCGADVTKALGILHELKHSAQTTDSDLVRSAADLTNVLSSPLFSVLVGMHMYTRLRCVLHDSHEAAWI
jgi:hypothetical protein